MFGVDEFLEPITNGKGNVTGDIAAEPINLAHLIRALEYATARNAELEEANSSLVGQNETLAARIGEIEEVTGQTLRSVAHDLRTPLCAVIGQAQLVRMFLEGGKTDPAINSAYAIYTAAMNMNEMITGLLKANKPYNPQHINNIGNLVREYIGELNGLLVNCPVPISLSCSAHSSAPIFADDLKINSALAVLVSNAIDAIVNNGIGGRIDVVVSDGYRNNSGYVCIAVKDNGSGMTPDKLENARSGSSFSDKGMRGNGIGLPQVKEIVQKHGGFIEIDSVYGQGSEFRMYIPATVQAAIPDLVTVR